MYSPEHLNQLCIHLLSSDFETVYNNTDPETAWLILRQIIFDIRCAIVPNKSLLVIKTCLYGLILLLNIC